jgi:hypothetical protein
MEISKNARQSVGSDSGIAIAVQPGQQAEIELKLLAPQGALEKLREMPVIVQHARNRGAFHWLETAYYDAPERLQGAAPRRPIWSQNKTEGQTTGGRLSPFQERQVREGK